MEFSFFPSLNQIHFRGFQESVIKRLLLLPFAPVLLEINEREAVSSGELAKGRITTSTHISAWSA
jgi:hypothetical protein